MKRVEENLLDWMQQRGLNSGPWPIQGQLGQPAQHSPLELHAEVEWFCFIGCRHRSSTLRLAISPAALWLLYRLWESAKQMQKQSKSKAKAKQKQTIAGNIQVKATALFFSLFAFRFLNFLSASFSLVLRREQLAVLLFSEGQCCIVFDFVSSLSCIATLRQ